VLSRLRFPPFKQTILNVDVSCESQSRSAVSVTLTTMLSCLVWIVVNETLFVKFNESYSAVGIFSDHPTGFYHRETLPKRWWRRETVSTLL
jgi:hypothetical protein